MRFAVWWTAVPRPVRIVAVVAGWLVVLFAVLVVGPLIAGGR